MKTEFLSNNPKQTQKIGEFLGREILRTGPLKKALVIGLKGDLGGGKTTFLQGLARGLGIKEKILSPTFVIMKRFPPTGEAGGNFYHIDCYRIQKPKELLELGFKEIIAQPKNIMAIEWAERVKKLLPRGTILITFEFGIDKNARKIKIKT